MPKQWDIVGVPADMWPWDDQASDFFAVIVSSGWAREKAGIYWFCPIREGKGRIAGEPGAIPVHQIAHPSPKFRRPLLGWLGPQKLAMPSAPRSEPRRIPWEFPIARIDLMITGGRHELLPWDCGTIDRHSRRLLAREMRKFVGF